MGHVKAAEAGEKEGGLGHCVQSVAREVQILQAGEC